MKIYDAVVVGEGPAGITAAMYLARAGCSVLLFEQLTPGGQILMTENIENYPGYPRGIKGYELADLFAEHLNGLNVDKPVGEVSSISGKGGDFLIKAEANLEEFRARSVLVCGGARHRLLGVDREEELTGKGVSYCALCDGNFYRNQEIAVVGGGNAAMEEALYLSKIASKVHLIHRRDAFRGNKVYQDKLLASPDKINLHMESAVDELIGEKELEGVVVRNLITDSKTVIPAKGLFIYVGFMPSTGYLPKDLEKDAQGFIITDTEMRTNIPGIFAAGDIRSKICRQVITAAGDGATAAQSAFVYLEQLDV